MNETIHEVGRVSGDRVEIGTSSVFSRLIQEAGRWCESYASDLLVDIDRVRRVLGTEPYRWREIVGDAVTDTEENLFSILGFLSEIGVGSWELLPYNPLARNKYSAIGKEYSDFGDKQSREFIDKTVDSLNKKGTNVKVFSK